MSHGLGASFLATNLADLLMLSSCDPDDFEDEDNLPISKVNFSKVDYLI